MMLIQRGVKNIHQIGGAIEVAQTLLLDPYGDYLVYDTFTDDDAVTLGNHTPEKDTVGDGWTQVGTDSILTNRAVYANVGKGSYIFTGANDLDITWILENTDLSPSQPGACFRVSADGLTYLVLRTIANALLYLDQDDLTNIATAGITWTNPATLRVTVVGNDINAYWNGDLKITVTNAYAAGGTGVGLWSWGGSQGVDSLTVEAA